MNQSPTPAQLAPETAAKPHVLPPLPYAYAALEPYLDARTLTLHHDKHHASYVTNLNAALEKHPALFEHDALWLLRNMSQVPDDIGTAVRHNAGGHVNHSFYWLSMSPAAAHEPSATLAEALARDFGGMDKSKAEFESAGEKLFGSGWVWLVRDAENHGRLKIIPTSGHDNPWMQGHRPILVNDVWEHAYYLKYENRRAEYLKAWWSVVNWAEVSRRFDAADPDSPTS